MGDCCRNGVGIKPRKRRFTACQDAHLGRKLSQARSVKLKASEGRAAAEPANGGVRAQRFDIGINSGERAKWSGRDNGVEGDAHRTALHPTGRLAL